MILCRLVSEIFFFARKLFFSLTNYIVVVILHLFRKIDFGVSNFVLGLFCQNV